MTFLKTRRHTDETRVKISESRQGIVPWNKGRIGVYSDETRTKMSLAHIGVSLSPERRVKISAALKGNTNTRDLVQSDEVKQKHREAALKLWENSIYRSHVLARRFPTSLEYALQMLLESAKLVFVSQESFGRYTVDFWVPSHELVLEADGYHHIAVERRNQDMRRDAKILREYPVRSIIRLTARDLIPWTEV